MTTPLAEQVAAELPCRTQLGENYDFCDGDSHDLDCWAYKRPRILALVETAVAEASERVRRETIEECEHVCLDKSDDLQSVHFAMSSGALQASLAIAALKENKR